VFKNPALTRSLKSAWWPDLEVEIPSIKNLFNVTITEPRQWTESKFHHVHLPFPPIKSIPCILGISPRGSRLSGQYGVLNISHPSPFPVTEIALPFFFCKLYKPLLFQLNSVFLWRMPSSGMLRRVALVRTDFSEERIASIMGVIRIGELETTLAVTSSRSMLPTLFLDRRFFSPWWWRRYVPTKRTF
jgi:hypothetical protein